MSEKTITISVPETCSGCDFEAPMPTFGFWCPYLMHKKKTPFTTTQVRDYSRLEGCPIEAPEGSYPPSPERAASEFLKKARMENFSRNAKK